MRLQSTRTSCFETETRTELDWAISEQSWDVRPGNISIPCWLGIQKTRRKSNRKHYARLSSFLRDFILGAFIVVDLTKDLSEADSWTSGECASHFQGHLKKYPPQVSSRNAAAGWGCFIHNEVNTMLGKPEFDCNNIADFYDCGCAEDEKAAGHKDKSQAASRGVPQKKDHEGDATTPVEIHKEPSVAPQYFTFQLLTDHRRTTRG